MALLLLGLLGAWWASLSSPPIEAPPRPGMKDESAVRRVITPSVPAAEPAAPVDAESTARAELHATLAEELGLIAIRCPNPGFPDTPATGAFGARVERGVYTALVDEAKGAFTVQARTAMGPDGPFEVVDLFRVSWEGGNPGATVPCRISAERYATVRITVVDADGGRGADSVMGCGFNGPVPAEGLEKEVPAGRGCFLTASRDDEAGRWTGSTDIPALEEHAEHVVEVRLTRDGFEVLAEAILADAPRPSVPPARAAAAAADEMIVALRDELAVLEGIRPGVRGPLGLEMEEWIERRRTSVEQLERVRGLAE